MDPRNLYTLRYREGFGVQTTQIVASSDALADAVGKKWCASKINCRFIRTEKSISADESILSEADLAAAAPKPAKEPKPERPPAEHPVDPRRATAAAAALAAGVPTKPSAKAS